MMKTLVFVTLSASLLALGIFNSLPVDPNNEQHVPAAVHQLYSKWAVKYGKPSQTPAEHSYRITQFYRAYKKVKELRAQASAALFSLNKFSYLNKAEFASIASGGRLLTEKITPPKFFIKEDPIAKTDDMLAAFGREAQEIDIKKSQ